VMGTNICIADGSGESVCVDVLPCLGSYGDIVRRMSSVRVELKRLFRKDSGGEQRNVFADTEMMAEAVKVSKLFVHWEAATSTLESSVALMKPAAEGEFKAMVEHICSFAESSQVQQKQLRSNFFVNLKRAVDTSLVEQFKPLLSEVLVGGVPLSAKIIEDAEDFGAEDIKQAALDATQTKQMKKLYRKFRTYEKVATLAEGLGEAVIDAATPLLCDVRFVTACNVAIQGLMHDDDPESPETSKELLAKAAAKEITEHFHVALADLPPKLSLAMTAAISPRADS